VLVQDKAGASAAALAANGGHVECVARILDNSTAATERGLSALHLAVQVLLNDWPKNQAQISALCQ
jgi:hypothetical protein